MSNRKIINAASTGGIGYYPVGNPSDPYYDNVSLLLTGDTEVDSNFANVSLLLDGNTLTDKSNNKLAVTNTGSVTVSSTVKKFGTGSMAFNGSNYLTVPSNSVFSFGTGDFTVEAWVYRNAASGTYETIFGFDTSGQLLFQLYQNQLDFGIRLTQSNLSGVIVPINTWVHLAISRQSGIVNYFQNGVLIYTYTGAYATQNFTNSSQALVGCYSTAAGYWNGYIDDLRITKGVARYTSNFTPPVKALPTHEILDSSVYRLPVTAVGNARIDTATKKYGTGAMYFDGSGDYLTAQNSNAFTFGTGDFTIEGWYYFIDGTANAHRIMWSNYSSWSSGAIFYGKHLDYTGKVALWVNNYSASQALIYDPNPPTNSTWIHYAVTRSGNTVRLFRDGVSVASTTLGSTIDFTGTNDRCIVGMGDSIDIPFYGYMDDIRITKGYARYIANFTPPSASLPTIPPTISADPWWGNVSLLLDGNTTDAYDPYWQNVSLMLTGDDFIDWSNQHNAVTNNGTVTLDTTNKKFNASSLSFNGSSQYLTIPNNANLSFGTGNFTVEMWVRATALVAGVANQQVLLAGGSGNFAMSIYNGNVHIAQSNVANLADFADSSIQNNVWNHIAIVRTGTTIKCYVNGVQNATTLTDSTNFSSSGTAYISRNDTTAGYYFSGQLADFRITKGIARTITVPTAALPAFKIQDRTQNNLTVTPYGNVKLSTDVMKNGTGSMFFDGTGDYLETPTTLNIANFGLNDYTVEFWVNYASASSAYMFVDCRGSNFGFTGLALYMTGGTFYYQYGASYIIIVATPSANTWHHIAASRANGNSKLFFDGIQQGTTVSDAVNCVNDYGVRIGSWYGGGYDFNGYIDDLRITKGYARYTQNFTPPSQSFATQYISTGYDANYADVSLLLNGNGTNGSTTFTDLSSGNNAITVLGSAQISTSIKKYGTGSVYLPSGSNALHVTLTSPLTINSSDDFTIECWVYITAFTSVNTIYNTGSIYEYLAVRSSGTILEWSTIVGSSTSFSYTFSLNTWYHIALVRTSGNTVKCFVNGTQAGTNYTYSGAVITTTPVRIGYYLNNPNSLNGYMDDFRITKGIARYTTNFTPPTYQLPTDTTGTVIDPLRASTSLLLRGNGTNGSTSFTDESPNGLTVTNNGPVAATINTTTKKYGTGSILFAGTSTSNCSKLVVTDTGFGTADFTLEMWVNFSSSAADQYIFDSRSAYNDTTGIALLYNDPGLSGKIGVFYGTGWLISTSVSTTTNAWTHVALCRIGTTFNIFINGVSGGTATLSANLSNTIYRFGSGNDNYALVSGYLDDIRVTKGIARYTTNFTPPTYEDPIITGTVYDYNYPQVSLLLNGDGTNGSTTFTDLSSSPKTITNINTVAVDTSVKKFGTGSIYFSGTNKYLSLAAPQIRFGTGDFTIEMWYYPLARGSTYPNILCGAFSLCDRHNNVITKFSIYRADFTPAVLPGGSVTVTANTWYHLAVVRVGTSWKLYVNGVLDISTNTSSIVSVDDSGANSGAWLIGSDGTNNINGYIDELRFTKGLARYTQNFTPPTAPLPTSYS